MAGLLTRGRTIIAVDYGTTFTGVAYVASMEQSARNVQLISDWPGIRRNVTYEKVPSQMARSGATAEPLTWMKLLLDQETDEEQLRKDSGHGLLASSGKSAQERLGKAVFNNLDLEIVITFPAVWTEKPRELTLQADIHAGFKRSDNQNCQTTISMITEPEAAAFSTLKPIKENYGGSNMKDLLSYKVTSMEPDFLIEEATVGTGIPADNRDSHNLEEIFKFSVDRSMKLIKGQIQKLQKQNADTKVRGFGKSEYLFKHIKRHCSKNGIEALRPDSPGQPTYEAQYSVAWTPMQDL
ncbi:MAG: hypothetical protein M1814_002752 [Vezdaea aestivalis]|nr:MAG: hypothetical protein M1814_002752 [Vezdaea aestivalis]